MLLGVSDVAMIKRYMPLAEKFPRSNLLQLLMLRAAPVDDGTAEVDAGHRFVPLAHRYLVARLRKGSPSLYVSLRAVLDDPKKVRSAIVQFINTTA